MVYFCYIDESGTPEVPGNTSHYVLAGLSIPISCWKFCERGISKIKQKYDLENSEIHTGWIVRKYIEQSKIVKFEDMNYAQRRYEVGKIRKMELLKLQKSPNNNLYKQTRKNYLQTEAYVHLTLAERIAFIQELADLIGGWSFARLFAESINKVHFDPLRAKQSVDEQALEQLVSRFEQYMKIVSKSTRDSQLYGTLIHDNNETDLLDRIQNRFDRKNGKIVGVRHFTDSSCQCKFCHKN